MVNDMVQTILRQQNLKTKIITEIESVGVDGESVMIILTMLFIEAHGYEVDKNIIYQDNKTSALIELYENRSSGKRTIALNIRYLSLIDKTGRGNVSVKY